MNLVTLTLSFAATAFLLASTTESVVNLANRQNDQVDSRQLQSENRVKIFQEKKSIVVIEAESVDRRRIMAETDIGDFDYYTSQHWKFESNNTKQTTAITDYLGSGYLRFNSKNISNSTFAFIPLATSLTYYINITNPGEYRLSIRTYKDGTIASTRFCNVQMQNFPGVLGGEVKTFMAGSSNEWGYRTMLQLNENSNTTELEVPIYAFPVRGTYRFVISGSMDVSQCLVDRLVFYDSTAYTVKYALSKNQSQSKFIFTKPPRNVLLKRNVPPTLPLLSPNFESTAQLPQYLFNTGIINETTVYYSEYDTTIILYGKSDIYNYSQHDVIVLPEWKHPYSTVSSMFQTHRTGESNFAYEFSDLYSPGTLVNVTLGFAENEPIICSRQRGRVFNITVNGQEYVNFLDVYGTVGCNVALLLSKPFQVNKSGKIVISFKSVKQSPMIALIGIDSAETSSNIQMDSISDTPSTFPSNAPSDRFSSAPSDSPSSFSSNTPSDAPSDIISDVPSIVGSIASTNTDREIVANEDSLSIQPSDSPSDAPSDSPSSISSNTPSDAPSDIISDVPSIVGSIASTNTDREIVANEDSLSIQPSDSPSDAPSDSPTSISSDTPSDAPSDIISDVPSIVGSIASTNTDKEIVANEDSLSIQPSTAPSDALPIVGLNLVESESGAFVSALHDGDVIERSTLGLAKNLTIVAETMGIVETVRFVYNGITHIEGVSPYAMNGKLHNGNKFVPVQYLSTNGLKVLKVDAYDITYTKSIAEVVIKFTII